MMRIVSMALGAILTVSCAPALMKLPSGTSRPASDSGDAVAAATTECRAVSTLSAEVGVAGRISGQRVRNRILAGLAAPASARLEGIAPFGPPFFIFASRDGDATLLLPREERVLEHGQPDRVLEALTGVPLGEADLRTTLTGCARAPEIDSGRALGEDWRIVRDGATDLYLHRTPAAPWRIVSAVHHSSSSSSSEVPPAGEWRAEYGDFQNGLPRTVRLASSDRRRFDLRLSLSQVDVNTPLGADVFRVRLPSSARPMSLDDLRHARPGVRQN
jgi:hypothetical protein